MFKNAVFLIFLAALTGGCCCHYKTWAECNRARHAPKKPVVYQDLNTGEPPAKIIKAQYKDAYEYARSVPSRQFVISENPPVEKPLEKAIRIKFSAFRDGIRVETFKERTVASERSRAVVPYSGQHSLTVYFAFNSCEVPSTEALKLHKFVTGLEHNGIRRVDITGYTDWIGSRQYNRRLALERARAVAQVFKTAGFDVGSITGKGKCCYTNLSDPGPNRRAEVSSVSRHRKEVSGKANGK